MLSFSLIVLSFGNYDVKEIMYRLKAFSYFNLDGCYQQMKKIEFLFIIRNASLCKVPSKEVIKHGNKDTHANTDSIFMHLTCPFNTTTFMYLTECSLYNVLR